MRYVFFGSPKFAAIILEKLIDAGYIPTAVVCNPDRPVGRKKIITPPPVKAKIMNYELGIMNKIKILQPEKLDEKFHNSLFKIHNSFDFFVVAAYANIISKQILDIPKLGTIGVHPSILPKHRGSSPIQTAILNNDEKTGVALYLMNEKMDNGPIIAQSKIKITAQNYEKLSEELANNGADLLIETLPKFLRGEITPKKQDHNQATFTKKFTTQDAFIEPDELEKAINIGGEIAVKIYNKIRALNPEPGTWTLQQAQSKPQRMKILEAELIDDKKLKLKKIQYEGAPRPKIL